MINDVKQTPLMKVYRAKLFIILATVIALVAGVILGIILIANGKDFKTGTFVLLLILSILFILCGGCGIAAAVIFDKNELAQLAAMDESEKSHFELEMKKFKDKFIKRISNVFVYIFLFVVAALSFLPFYWMIMSSFKTETEFRASVPTFFPHTFQWKNYTTVLMQANSSNGSFIQIFLNTILVGSLSTVLGVIVTVVTAYALARMNFKGKEVLFTLMLGTMMIPGEMFTLTNYLTVTSFHWADTYTVLILPFLVSIYYIYLLRNNFKQIPETLYQAAKVDGLSDMGYLIKVMVPLTAPTLISVTLLKFIGIWNSYIWPRLVNSGNWQLITNWVTRGFADKTLALYNGLYTASESLTTLKMAAVCIVSLPLLILFLCFRKYIMHGVSKSGIKG